jgi:hypothetical protein
MYGKLFASTFTGSMVGAGPVVFAVWGYSIAHAVDSQVELNPVLLSTVLGCPREQIDTAIGVLCAPDPNSRSKADDGRRLVREGQFAFRVVNHAKYNAMRHEGDRREYNRIKQREHRERVRLASVPQDATRAHSAPTGPRKPGKREQADLDRLELAAHMAVAGQKK